MTNPKILIVDDEPFNVDFLEQELEESEYETLKHEDEKINRIYADAGIFPHLESMQQAQKSKRRTLEKLPSNSTSSERQEAAAAGN